MIKKIVYSALLFFFLQSSLFSYSSNPKDFINELVQEAITKLADKNLDKDQKAKFVEKLALENVDVNALGLYTLGELRKSDPGEKFPWKRLNLHGLGKWYKDNKNIKINISNIESLFFKNLKKLGYNYFSIHKKSSYDKKIIKSFQMHYLPNPCKFNFFHGNFSPGSDFLKGAISE